MQKRSIFLLEKNTKARKLQSCGACVKGDLLCSDLVEKEPPLLWSLLWSGEVDDGKGWGSRIWWRKVRFLMILWRLKGWRGWKRGEEWRRRFGEEKGRSERHETGAKRTRERRRGWDRGGRGRRWVESNLLWNRMNNGVKMKKAGFEERVFEFYSGWPV